MTTSTCADCGGTMQPGYIVDQANYSVPTQSFWVEGEPEMMNGLIH